MHNAIHPHRRNLGANKSVGREEAHSAVINLIADLLIGPVCELYKVTVAEIFRAEQENGSVSVYLP